MAERWLLAAEADQIQDLLFRASRLREVVGGSQLLERFCEEAPRLLLDRVVGSSTWSDDDLIIHRGGAFRVLFDNREHARAFGADLVEAYRRLTGGSLSAAEPVPCGDDYRAAAADAHRALVRAKRRGAGPAAQAQMPYAAGCASCGTGLAVEHRERPGVQGEGKNYVCADCLAKFGESHEQQRAVDGDQEPFLGRFRCAVRERLGKRHPLRRPSDGDWSAAIGRLDGNRMVAYLAADGNGMGQVFARCGSPRSSGELSSSLEHVMKESLAAQCAALILHLTAGTEEQREVAAEIMPLLPLILGGDDLFALLPAPWALDLSCRLIRHWEQAMGEAMVRLGLGERATLSAALVLCKANYPHALARRRCEHELKRAKRVAHLHEGRSVLSYAVIVGNQTGEGPADETTRMEPTLAPFKLSVGRGGDDLVERLFEQRLELAVLPQKRRAELERLFDEVPPTPGKQTPTNADDRFAREWLPRLHRLLERIEREPKHREALEQALAVLGADARGRFPPYWRRVVRPWRPQGQGDLYGHALPDLLRLWPFLERVGTDAEGGESK